MTETDLNVARHEILDLSEEDLEHVAGGLKATEDTGG